MLGLWSAQTAQALTEEQVIRSVLLHFPLIEEARLKAESAAGEVTAAEGAFDHKLVFKSRNRIEDKYDNQYFETTFERQTPFVGTSLIAGHRQGLGHFPSYDGKYKTSGAGEIFAGFSVPVLRNLQTDEARTNLRISQLEKTQAEQLLRLKKLTTVHKALTLYYKWVLESQKLKINKEILALAKLRQDMIERKYRAGDLERMKVTDNLRAIDKRTGEVLKNEIDLTKVRTELGLYVRDPKGSPELLTVEESSELILRAPEAKFSGNSSKNPQLEILDLEAQKLQAELRFYDQSQLPGLNLSVLGAKELSPNAAYDPESLQLGIKFDLPLENRKAEGKTVAYTYKQKALEKQRSYLALELDQQYNFFLSASDLSRKRWEVTSREYENTKKMADAEKSRWTQGASDLFIVNLREQDVADVEIRRWSALYDYHQYLIDAKLFSAALPIDI